jgi:type I restriction enzyme M protein
MTRISQQQLESYLWGAATLLRGTIDAGDYKQFIFPLLFYKRVCDVFDEETETALKESGGDKSFAAYRENHRFQVPPEAHWFQVRQTSNNVGQALQSAMRVIETANPEKLYGIFGDAQWTNKDRLTDAMLRDLVEHFSSLELTLASLPEDELGQGYEYLIKKFADDAGHTAAEFYTNRTVVHLMTEMLEPQPGESIYDPTCGSGGMLLSCITNLRRQGKEWRNVRLYGQERNLMTSAIARMNCFLHGIEDFQIIRGDTLSDPKFVQGDRLMRFDVVLANPPYSIKQWDRDAFASDPWGRNLYGTPPQSRADYAFWQHILCSLAPKTGRCAILFPHGILFRDAEEEMRRKIIEVDLIECVVGLGPNLFYNSSMPSCVVICRTNKPKSRRQNILFINADSEVTRDRAQSFLTNAHIDRIVNSYRKFRDDRGFARVVKLEEVRAKNGDLNLPLYVPSASISPMVAAINGESVAWALRALMDSLTAADRVMSVLIGEKAAFERKAILRIPSEMPLIQDRRHWPKVRLGDIVVKTEETQRKPLEAGFDRYLLVEHLDANSLRIRRWGQIDDGSLPPTFYKVFRKGQVLYPTRNPHLRRVVVADFDGICGEKTLTLTSGEQVNAHFLPFIFQSEAFIAHATNRRIGSTNPHVRWRDIADFELLLPPIDRQRRIAEILWALDDVESRYFDLVLRMTELTKSESGERFPPLSSCTRSVELSEICVRQPQSGIYKGPTFVGRGVKTVNMKELFGNDVIDRSVVMESTDLSSQEIAKYSLTSNDLLFGRRSIVLDGAGKCAMVGELDEPVVFESSILRVTIDSARALPGFVCAWLNSPEGSREIRRIRSFTTIAGISGSALKRVRIPLPSVRQQEKIVAWFAEQEDRMATLSITGEQCRILKGQLYSALIGPTLQ